MFFVSIGCFECINLSGYVTGIMRVETFLEVSKRLHVAKKKSHKTNKNEEMTKRMKKTELTF
jgi:hypothetical protein